MQDTKRLNLVIKSYKLYFNYLCYLPFEISKGYEV